MCQLTLTSDILLFVNTSVSRLRMAAARIHRETPADLILLLSLRIQALKTNIRFTAEEHLLIVAAAWPC